MLMLKRENPLDLMGKLNEMNLVKKVRYPVILRADEKLIAMKICLVFKVNYSEKEEEKNVIEFLANCLWF